MGFTRHAPLVWDLLGMPLLYGIYSTCPSCLGFTTHNPLVWDLLNLSFVWLHRRKRRADFDLVSTVEQVNFALKKPCAHKLLNSIRVATRSIKYQSFCLISVRQILLSDHCIVYRTRDEKFLLRCRFSFQGPTRWSELSGSLPWTWTRCLPRLSVLSVIQSFSHLTLFAYDRCILAIFCKSSPLLNIMSASLTILGSLFFSILLDRSWRSAKSVSEARCVSVQ